VRCEISQLLAFGLPAFPPCRWLFPAHDHRLINYINKKAIAIAIATTTRRLPGGGGPMCVIAVKHCLHFVY